MFVKGVCSIDFVNGVLLMVFLSNGFVNTFIKRFAEKRVCFMAFIKWFC